MPARAKTRTRLGRALSHLPAARVLSHRLWMLSSFPAARPDAGALRHARHLRLLEVVARLPAPHADYDGGTGAPERALHRRGVPRSRLGAGTCLLQNELGQAVRAAGGRLPTSWLEGVLHRLKHQGSQRVLQHLTWLAARYPSPPIQQKLSYLQKREAHLQYPTYQQAGWPIGSGSVESANKVVVKARLKGAGIRWDRQNVNPMLVLRKAVCNRQWNQTWATALAHRQALRTSRRQARSQQRMTSAFWTH